jgi:hypothetical protein
MDAPIGGQLLSHRQVICGRILYVPDMTPTGAGNEWAGVSNATAEDNDVLPCYGAGRDNTPGGLETQVLLRSLQLLQPYMQASSHSTYFRGGSSYGPEARHRLLKQSIFPAT